MRPNGDAHVIWFASVCLTAFERRVRVMAGSIPARSASLQRQNEERQVCNVPECEKAVFGRGMCSQHYFKELRAEKAIIDRPGERGGNRDPKIDYNDFWLFVKQELNL